jgi:hypothetical protein
MALAHDGRALDGRSRLAAGLSRMEMLESLGLPWAVELAGFYRHALDLYGKVYFTRTRHEGAQAVA